MSQSELQELINDNLKVHAVHQLDDEVTAERPQLSGVEAEQARLTLERGHYQYHYPRVVLTVVGLVGLVVLLGMAVKSSFDWGEEAAPLSVEIDGASKHNTAARVESNERSVDRKTSSHRPALVAETSVDHESPFYFSSEADPITQSRDLTSSDQLQEPLDSAPSVEQEPIVVDNSTDMQIPLVVGVPSAVTERGRVETADGHVDDRVLAKQIGQVNLQRFVEYRTTRYQEPIHQANNTLESTPASAGLKQETLPDAFLIVEPAQPESAGDNSKGSVPEVSVLSDHIARANLARRIVRREPVDEVQSQPSVSEDKITHLYFFTDVRSMAGQSITHSWSLNGVPKATVKMRIGSEQWRCYSQKRLDETMTGDWQVTVTNEAGEELAISQFLLKP